MIATAAVRREPITVRRMSFELTPDIPDNWGADNNTFITALMTALSASFPAGERYFIDSVRHYAERIEDPELKARVRAFIGQEANHTKEHLAFNRFLAARGAPTLRIEKRVEAILNKLRAERSPAVNLAHTVALEHLTAFLASAALENPELFFEKMHPTVAAFWGWHLIEEIEHRSVAFEVYKTCVDDERLRLRAMAITTAIFSVLNLARTASVMRARGELGNIKAWVSGIDYLFGRKGVLRKSLPLYRAFYRRDFHPDQHDNKAALERAKAQYISGFERAAAS